MSVYTVPSATSVAVVLMMTLPASAALATKRCGPSLRPSRKLAEAAGVQGRARGAGHAGCAGARVAAHAIGTAAGSVGERTAGVVARRGAGSAIDQPEVTGIRGGRTALALLAGQAHAAAAHAA